MTRPKGIELFCGCGGISTGFLDAGIQITAGYDLDKRAVEAYNYNHSYRGSQGHLLDLSRTSGKELLASAKLSRVDVLVGGPPCQPFSIAGKREGERDERSDLIKHFLRFTRELRPQAVFFENVPNLAVVDEGKTFQQLITSLKRLGYAIDFGVKAAADFGVPQVRKRLLLVGSLDARNISLPQPTHGPGNLPHLTASEAIEDLPLAGDYGECGIYNHEPTEHTPDMLRRFASLRPGQREKRSFHDRLHPDRPAYTLRAGTGNFSPLRPVHYKYDRVITVRESARLQSFDNSFIWPDWIPRLQQYRQVGNAVPPRVAMHVATALADQLGWSRDPVGCKGEEESRPSAITLTDEERRARRRSRMRGASLGKNYSRLSVF